MPQDRISGADANKYGRETARKIAIAIGAIPISEASNEFILGNRKITIRCARKINPYLGCSHRLLGRVNAVIAALEQENGDYKLYGISPDKFRRSMTPTRSRGPSAGRVSIVKKSMFINEGEFIRDVKLITEDKIARICWNDYGWQRPSGREGKSRNVKSYEYKVGYGHEEWLFDKEKLITGYYYGYLQPVGKAWGKYQGKIFNISLYSINNDTGERWWIGTINNAQVLSPDESKKVYAYYKKKGWFHEMIKQIKNIGGKEKDFINNAPIGFVNIKYKPQDLQLLDPPQRISSNDSAISCTYYVLLNKVKDPKIELPFGDDPKFSPGYTPRKEQNVAYYGERKSEVSQFHYKMQKNVYKQLMRIYGHCNVRMERPIGTGVAIDLSVKEGEHEIFYEFKTSNSLRTCIREALSQLFEYSYYPDKERAKRLIIVSQNPMDKQVKDYLTKIRTQFNIPVYYKQYNTSKNCLEEIEY